MSGVPFWIAVALLSAAGALVRYLVDVTVADRVGARFPIGTALVNLTGALALGVATGAAVGHGLMLLLGTALIGSYSTFSTWMWESLLLAEDGRGRAAAVNVAGQAVLGIAVAATGWWLGAAL